MARIDLPHTFLDYQVRGSGPPVVLSPGLAGLSSFWAKQVEVLSAKFKVITYDHRGCGKSDLEPAAVSIETMAQDLLALLDALGIERASIAGHSTGGAICQHLAAHASERLEKIIVSCSWTAADAYMRTLFHIRRGVLENCGVDDFSRVGALFLYPPRYLHERPELLAPRRIENPAQFTDTMKRRIEAILRFDSRAYLQRIGVPTLVIGASDDALTPGYFSEELASLIPDSKLALLAYGGHYCPVVSTREYNTALMDFLAT